jgi:hypothetical protein
VLERNVSGTEHVIWTGTAFVAPLQVALRCALQVKPWAMRVPQFTAQFKHLTAHVGFMNEFGAEHYLRILSELHAQYGGTALSAKHLRQVLKIVRYLSAEILTRGADHVPLDHVLVPTTAGVLKSSCTRRLLRSGARPWASPPRTSCCCRTASARSVSAKSSCTA